MNAVCFTQAKIFSIDFHLFQVVLVLLMVEDSGGEEVAEVPQEEEEEEGAAEEVLAQEGKSWSNHTDMKVNNYSGSLFGVKS